MFSNPDLYKIRNVIYDTPVKKQEQKTRKIINVLQIHIIYLKLDPDPYHRIGLYPDQLLVFKIMDPDPCQMI